MARFISVAAISVLAALPQAFAGNLIIDNSCDFSIYCAGAKNDGTFTEVIRVAAGEALQSLKPANNDNIGAVLKCGMDDTLESVYQMEMAVRDGKTWLDLSALDGSPFVAYHRHAEIPGVSDFYLPRSISSWIFLLLVLAFTRRAEEHVTDIYSFFKTSCTLDCQAGETGCEWPTSVDCISDGDAILTLCGNN